MGSNGASWTSHEPMRDSWLEEMVYSLKMMGARTLALYGHTEIDYFSKNK